MSPIRVIREPRPIRYFRTAASFAYDSAGVDALASMRHVEQARMRSFMHGKECLMLFAARELDDQSVQNPCGRCSVCRGRSIVTSTIAPETLAAAEDFWTPARSVSSRARPGRTD